MVIERENSVFNTKIKKTNQQKLKTNKQTKNQTKQTENQKGMWKKKKNKKNKDRLREQKEDGGGEICLKTDNGNAILFKEIKSLIRNSSMIATWIAL